MHERGLAEKVFRMSLEKAGGREIEKIYVRIGELRAVEPESLKLWFDSVAREHNIEGASLVVEKVPVRWACSYCGVEYDPDSDTLVCANCLSRELTMISGEEIEVTRVE